MENIQSQLVSCADFAKCLAHPVRLEILRILIDKGRATNGAHPCTCGDNCGGPVCQCGCNCSTLTEQLPVAQSTVSQHLKELKKNGLINIDGRKGEYALNHRKLSEGLISLLSLLGLNKIETMEEMMKCNCGENCTCGNNCTCGTECQCVSDCNCGCECQCGCGENCQCGADCTCGCRQE